MRSQQTLVSGKLSLICLTRRAHMLLYITFFTLGGGATIPYNPWIIAKPLPTKRFFFTRLDMYKSVFVSLIPTSPTVNPNRVPARMGRRANRDRRRDWPFVRANYSQEVELESPAGNQADGLRCTLQIPVSCQHHQASSQISSTCAINTRHLSEDLCSG